MFIVGVSSSFISVMSFDLAARWRGWSRGIVRGIWSGPGVCCRSDASSSSVRVRQTGCTHQNLHESWCWNTTVLTTPRQRGAHHCTHDGGRKPQRFRRFGSSRLRIRWGPEPPLGPGQSLQHAFSSSKEKQKSRPHRSPSPSNSRPGLLRAADAESATPANQPHTPWPLCPLSRRPDGVRDGMDGFDGCAESLAAARAGDAVTGGGCKRGRTTYERESRSWLSGRMTCKKGISCFVACLLEWKRWWSSYRKSYPPAGRPISGKERKYTEGMV